jgi:hypothetical protein
MCSKKPPKPDPLIGEAARDNAALAREQHELAKEQLAWEKDRAIKQDPLIEKVVNQQIASGDANAARAESQWQIYRDLFAPIEERMVKDANEFDSPERKSRMAAEAGADVGRGYDAAADTNQRQMERMGINPNSGRFQAMNNEMSINRAKDTAGAMNKARRDTELLGMSQRQSAANFGRNMPNTGLAADSAALTGGSNAIGNLNAGNAARNASMNTAQNWFGGSQGANSSAANIMNAQYGNQLNAWSQHEQNKAASMSGLGSLAGMGAAMLMRKGGVIRNNRPHRPAYSKPRYNYAAGGLVRGPGTGTSDSIPAVIEGVQPARLSNGEAVLNAEAVQLVGEDFVHRINSVGLSSLPPRNQIPEGEG